MSDRRTPLAPPQAPTERRPTATALFATNLVLAVAWVAMTGSFSAEGFVIGFALGYGVLFAISRVFGGSAYFGKAGRVLGFVLFYLRELVVANLRVAYDVVTPTHHMHPGVVAVPLDARTPGEITLLANLITMTPGTLSLDVSDDHTVLYVHGMFVDNEQAFIDEVKRGLERRVLETMR